MSERNLSMRELVDLYVEIVNEQRLDELASILTDDFVSHLRIGDLAGRESFRAMMVGFYEAFPDVRWHVQETVAEGDRVVVRYYWEGVQRAAWMGIPPTHKMVRADGLELLHTRDGKIAEVWNYSDIMGLAAQLGSDAPLSLEI